MNLLLIGNGFIGNHFYNLFENNYNIKILSRNINYNIDKGIQYPIVNNDFNEKCFENIDVIVYTIYSHSYYDNIILLDKIYKLSSKYNIKKIIYLDTMSIYNFSNKIIDEKTEKTNFNEVYAKNKLRISNHIKNISIKNNINTKILNLSVVLGLGSSWNKYAIDSLLQGNIELPYNGKSKGYVNIIHVEDLCVLIDTIINTKHNDNNEILNVSSGVMITWYDFYNIYKNIITKLGYKSGSIYYEKPNGNLFSKNSIKNMLYYIVYTILGYNILSIIKTYKQSSNDKINRDINFNIKCKNSITVMNGYYRYLHLSNFQYSILKVLDKYNVRFKYNTKDRVEEKILNEYKNNNIK
jgi:nucleoside-diphosphate-sugar epimerase